eukprot:g17818.t1
MLRSLRLLRQRCFSSKAGKPRYTRPNTPAAPLSNFRDAIARMRRACGLAAEALQVACEAAKEGVTTDEVDRRTSEFIIGRGAYPVGINYHGFPRGLCASPNEVALHGVPNTRPLESGDIINFDVTVYSDEAFGDCSAMVCVGDIDEDARFLVDATKECLDEAVQLVGPGVKLNQIGHFCHTFARKRGLHVVSQFCGHFIGSELHMLPNVSHVPNSLALELLPGMTFTIEPIFLEGMKALGDRLHELGFKYGIYTDRGFKTCAGRPASLGYEADDGRQFASWQVDFLKNDGCVDPDCVALSNLIIGEVRHRGQKGNGTEVSSNGRCFEQQWPPHSSFDLRLEPLVRWDWPSDRSHVASSSQGAKASKMLLLIH